MSESSFYEIKNRIKKSIIITECENLWYEDQISSLILASSSYKNERQHFLKILITVSHTNAIEQFQEMINMINCETIEANYIDTTFVRNIEAVFMKNYFSKMMSIDEKELTSTAYNSLYALNIATNEKKSSTHIFRALSMKRKMILKLSWLQAVNSVIDWKIDKIEIQNNIEIMKSIEFLKKFEQNTFICFSNEKSKQQLSYLRVKNQSFENLSKTYKEYNDVFDETETNELFFHKEKLNHAIKLKKEKSSSCDFLYNLSEHELSVFKKYIDKHLKNDFISRSKSSAEASILFIKKTDESLRLCVNYRELNAIVVKNKYSISLITNILNRLRKAKVFIKLDFREVYNLLRIKKKDEWKIAFRTKYETFEYNVLSFELLNEEVSFQSYIDRTLTDFLNKFCICYLNDILIYSKNKKKHEKHVQQILKALKRHRLFAKLNKCSFSKNWVKYLNFIVTTEKIVMNFSRIETITSWSILRTIKKIQSFFEFCNFYKRFIKNYNNIARALTNATTNIKFNWTNERQINFQNFQQAFTKVSFLKHFDSEKQIKLKTDASEFEIATILTQLYENTHFHSMIFHFKKLKQFERNYVTHNQELLTIVNAFKVWKHYLKEFTHKIIVFCDHNNLRFFMSLKSLIKRQTHWTEFLTDFDFIIKHKSDKRNSANASSKRSDYKSNESVTLLSLFKLIAITLEKTRKISMNTCSDLILCEMRMNNTDQASEQKHESSTDEESKFRFSTNLIDELKKYTALNEEIQKIVKEDSTNFVNKKKLIFCEKNLIYVSKAVRLRVFRNFHDSVTTDHFERNKIVTSLKRWFYWSKMTNFVDEYVRTCDTCIRTKLSKHSSHEELMSLSASNRVWSNVTINFITDLSKSSSYKSKNVHDTIMIAVNRLIKMTHYSTCSKNMNSKQFADLMLKDVISHHEMSKRFISDRETLFTSHFWRVLSRKLKTNHRLSTSFYSQTDDQTERQNQTLKQYFRKVINFLQDDWVEHLSLTEYSYNDSYHSIIETTSFRANFEKNSISFVLHSYHEKIISLSEKKMIKSIVKLQDELIQRLFEAQDYQTMYYDKKHIKRQFKERDEIMLKRTNLKTKRSTKKFDVRMLRSFQIKRIVNLQTYKLKLFKTYKMHSMFHVSLLKFYHRNKLTERMISSSFSMKIVIQKSEKLKWEIEKILKSRKRYDKIQYLMKWKDYENTAEETSWQSIDEVENSTKLMNEFHEEHSLMSKLK